MRLWHGVIVKLARNRKAAAVKNKNGPEELLVPFSLSTLVEVDLDARIYYSDQDDTAWVEGEDERKQAIIGTEVELLTDTLSFPEDAEDIISANFRFALHLVKNEQSGVPKRGALVIIFHDFRGENAKGDSGSAFAKAVIAYAKTLGKPIVPIEANSTYADLIGRLRQAVSELSQHFFVESILIATHGNSGQLWLGNPNNPKSTETVGHSRADAQFVEPQTFGAALKDICGSNLAIAIYSCNFVGSTDGENCAKELRAAADARAIYAGAGIVYLHAPLGGRPTVTCDFAYVVYKATTIGVFAGKEVPVFDL